MAAFLKFFRCLRRSLQSRAEGFRVAPPGSGGRIASEPRHSIWSPFADLGFCHFLLKGLCLRRSCSPVLYNPRDSPAFNDLSLTCEPGRKTLMQKPTSQTEIGVFIVLVFLATACLTLGYIWWHGGT